MKRLWMAGLSAMVLGACGGGGGEAAGSQEASAEYAGPIGSTDVAHGQEVYDQICAGCHSSGPSLENIGWSAARVRQQIREGSGRMPPIREARVSADDMEAILAYLATIGGVADEGGEPASTGGGETMERMEADETSDGAVGASEGEPLEDDL
ncbi:MAG: cytochrome c [Myxococcales bacterium]|nr:cytochrome c [Myxococcales bacterium]